MSKNTDKIKAGLKKLAHREYELMSGVVLPGSVDLNAYTCSVTPTGWDNPITGVQLSAVTQNGNGIIVVPADGSDVVIGSIDGPGIYCIVKTGTIVKTVTTINTTVLTIDENGYKITRGGNDLMDVLADLLTNIKAITVTTSNGPSGTPINAASFDAIKDQLNQILT